MVKLTLCGCQTLVDHAVTVILYTCIYSDLNLKRTDFIHPVLLLEDHYPAEFSSNPNRTLLKHLIKVLEIARNVQEDLFGKAEAGFSKTLALQKKDCITLFVD